jgi:hypothetical protein
MASRKLQVTTKSGFKVNAPSIPIVIRDYRGILFYSTEHLTPKVTQFNLPIGEYLVDSGDFTPMLLPVAYKPIKLPKYERVMKQNPKKFKIQFEENPNKCSVFWGKQLIIFDNSFKDAPLYQIDFILGHEHGHRFYKTESKCDLYAANEMLKKGYNASQIGVSPIESLSERQYDRMETVVDKLINR